MKKVFITGSIRDFENFVNREDIEILQVDVKTMELSQEFQECFAGIVFYKLLTAIEKRN